jgi:tetratricopeptide (TPR) repeat protein
MSPLSFFPAARVNALVLALALALSACASRPVPELAVQRYESAVRNGNDKLAAGDLPQATAAFAQAEQVATLYDRRALRMQALFALGAVAALAEQDEASRQAYAQALAEAQALNDAHGRGVAWAGLADTMRRAGDREGALQLYSLALAPQALRADSAERLQARMGLALVWHAQGDTPAALDALGTLEAQARAASSPLLPGVLVNQAVVLRYKGDVHTALAKAQEALALDRLQANPAVLAKDLELLGGLYAANQSAALARDSWERALRIAQATGQSKLQARLKQALIALR